MIKGYPCNPEVWYPKELLSTEWVRFAQATRQGESLGFVEAFLWKESCAPVSNAIISTTVPSPSPLFCLGNMGK